MVEVHIHIDGDAATRSELFDWLRDDPRLAELNLRTSSADDGHLGAIDTIIAAVGAVAAMGSLLVAIAAYRKSMPVDERPRATLVSTKGTRVTFDGADLELAAKLYRIMEADETAETPEA